MTYKDLWKQQHPDKNFSQSGCRDYEFLLEVTKDCGDKRCTSCWLEEVKEEEIC